MSGCVRMHTYHWEFIAEDVVTEAGDEVEEEMAATDVAMDVEGHLSLDLVPLGHHLVPLQPVAPALQLLEIRNRGDKRALRQSRSRYVKLDDDT